MVHLFLGYQSTLGFFKAKRAYSLWLAYFDSSGKIWMSSTPLDLQCDSSTRCAIKGRDVPSSFSSFLRAFLSIRPTHSERLLEFCARSFAQSSLI